MLQKRRIDNLTVYNLSSALLIQIYAFGFNVNFHFLTVCPGGQTRDGLSTGPCMDCGEGKFKNETGNQGCDNCPDPFHTTLTNRSTNASACSKLHWLNRNISEMIAYSTGQSQTLTLIYLFKKPH